MTTRRQFLYGGVAAAVGAGALTVGRRRDPVASSGEPGPSPKLDRVVEAIEASVGHRFDADQISSFVGYLDREHPRIWDPSMPPEAAERLICTQFIMTSNLAVNGMDLGHYQFFDDELVCSPYARFD